MLLYYCSSALPISKGMYGWMSLLGLFFHFTDEGIKFMETLTR